MAPRAIARVSLPVLLLLAVAAPAAAAPLPGPVQTVVPASASPARLGGLSIARDGTGGLVYLAAGDGTEHVFVSRLHGGVFGAGEQVDGGLPEASSQPVIAAGRGGVLLVAFINAGTLYVTRTTGPGQPWARARELHVGAENPSIGMSNAGKAYLTCAVTAGRGHDVIAYYWEGAWSPAGAGLNLTHGDDAGTGGGAPAVATAGDGVGLVVWGEAGHIYSRRVWGTSPSVETERDDPASFDGERELGASDPQVSVGGNSSYPDIVYDERLTTASGTEQTRVLLTRLVAEDTEPAVAVDGLGGGASGGSGEVGGAASSGVSESASDPGVAIGEYGSGLTTAVDDTSGAIAATTLATDGVPAAQWDPLQPPATLSGPVVPAIDGRSSGLVAWEQASAAGSPQIAVRLAEGGFQPAQRYVLWSAAAGSGQTPAALAAAGDFHEDAAVAWSAQTSAGLQIDAVKLYGAPGPPKTGPRRSYSRTSRPVLHWSPSATGWGPLTYAVTLDGSVLEAGQSTSLRVPSKLADGPHPWTVTATDPVGRRSTSRRATVFVDTVPPKLRATLAGARQAGRELTLRIRAADTALHGLSATASGLAAVTVYWGDHTRRVRGRGLTRATHAYARAGSYRIRVRAVDRAGNSTTRLIEVRIGRS